MKMTKGKTTIQELRKQERPLKAPKETNRGEKNQLYKSKSSTCKSSTCENSEKEGTKWK